MATIHVTKDSFQDEVLNSDIPVLVDFWASWCGPCKMLSPLIEDISNEVDHIKVCKVDVDACPELAMEYKVMSIPFLVLFKNGEIVKKSVGVISKSEILEMIS